MWTEEICDTPGFTKCLEIFHQVPWNCPLLSAPISTISCRPFSPARADKNVLFCMTLKESKLAGPHIAPASTIVFLLPVCEAGFCQCMNGGCSICQGWAKVWVGQSDSDKKMSYKKSSDWTDSQVDKVYLLQVPSHHTEQLSQIWYFCGRNLIYKSILSPLLLCIYCVGPFYITHFKVSPLLLDPSEMWTFKSFFSQFSTNS